MELMIVANPAMTDKDSAGQSKRQGVPPVLPEDTSNLRHDVFSLVEGNATFQWPTPLSAASAEDLKAWIEILQKKIARSVKAGDTILERPDN